jgi:GntR family carbon starvation induced transcriptional regulator
MNTQTRKATKTDIILEKLHQDIISNVFAPGEKLPLSSLKERYQVGASPLREALSSLTTSGLVELEPQCGFRIPPISLEELFDIYRVREAIMDLAIEMAIAQHDDAWEADLLAYHHRLSRYLTTQNKIDVDEWERRQKDFFQMIVKGAKSPWLQKIHDMLFDQAARYRMLCLHKHFLNKKLLNKVTEENQQLVNSILAKDLKKALNLSQQIYRDSAKSIEEILQEHFSK